MWICCESTSGVVETKSVFVNLGLQAFFIITYCKSSPKVFLYAVLCQKSTEELRIWLIYFSVAVACCHYYIYVYAYQWAFTCIKYVLFLLQYHLKNYTEKVPKRPSRMRFAFGCSRRNIDLCGGTVDTLWFIIYTCRSVYLTLHLHISFEPTIIVDGGD